MIEIDVCIYICIKNTLFADCNHKKREKKFRGDNLNLARLEIDNFVLFV